MTTDQAVSQRVLSLCQMRGITVNALANLSAVRQSTVNDIVTGKTKNAGIVTLKKLCDGLDISLAEFFDTAVFRSLEQEIY